MLAPATRSTAATANKIFRDRKSTRLNSSHGYISYAVFCLKKKTVTAGSIVHSTSVTFAITGSFGIVTSPPSPGVVVAGSSTTSTVTLSSSCLQGTVSLTAILPSNIPGLTASFNPNPVTLPLGGSSASTLTVSTTPSTPAGSYSIQVSAPSGSQSLTVSVSVSVSQDFTLSASGMSPASILAGRSAVSTITLDSLGLTGGVQLSASIAPSSGVVASFNVNPVIISPGSSASSSLMISTTPSTPAGDYIVTITGRYGIVSHSASATITVTGDFTVTVTPTNPAVAVGASSNVIISLNSTGLSGQVSLSASILPSSPNTVSVSFSQNKVPISPGGSALSAMTVSASPSTPPGAYSLIVN